MRKAAGLSRLLPFALVAGLVGIAPFLNALITSFTALSPASVDNASGALTRTFGGIANYKSLLADKGLPLSAGITLLWAFLSASLTVCAAYPLVALAHGSRKFYNTLFPLLVLAWATPVYIGAPLWRFILHGAAGNSLFRTLTGIELNFMDSPVAAFASTIVVSAWFRLPQAVFILLAAMGRSRKELDDAAAMDGAGLAAIAFSIRLPSMAGTLIAIGALEFVAACKEFTVPFLLTAGGPPLRMGVTDRTVVGATTTIEIYLYDLFSSYADSGVVSAYSVVFALSIAGVVLLAFFIRSRFTGVNAAFPDRPSVRNWIPGKISDAAFISGSWAGVILLLLAAVALVWCIFWMAFSGLSVAFVDSFLPRFPTLKNFPDAFLGDRMDIALLNTIFVSSITALFVCLTAFPAAAWLAEKSPAKAAAFFIAIQVLSSTGGIHSLIPLYDLWRRIGILGGYIPVILVYVYHCAPVAIFALAEFMRDQPKSFREAAKLEGMDGFPYLRKIQLPLAAPAIGAVAMIAFLSAWNGFLAPLIFLDDDSRYTVAVKLHSYVGSIASGSPKWNRFAAASIVNILIIGLLFWRFKKPLTHTALADHGGD